MDAEALPRASSAAGIVPGDAGGPHIEQVEQVFQRSAPAVWRAIYAYSGGRTQVADDAVAEAFARALPAWDALRDPLA